MKYYKNAFDRIIEASQRAPEDQCLFLVADVNNKFDKNAVMLHNGVQKLGHISASECGVVKRFLSDEALERGQDVVLVVSMLPANDTFHWNSSFTVKVVGLVNERVARKYAATISKKES